MSRFSLSLALVAALASQCAAADAPAPAAPVGPAANPQHVEAPAGIVSFAPMLKGVSPCVVTVYSSRTVKAAAQGLAPELEQDPFFRHFLRPDLRTPPRKERGLGSGVIVRSNGFILTNNHVVENADDVKVGFGDGSADIPAKVVGTDPQTDLAVLKIDAGSRTLPAMPLGDSSKVEVGNLVFAVGNPFGVGQTVTMGIISAVGRGGMNIEDYEDFLQTDASINPGNSGGALVTSDGRLVGINTAILSPSGGNLGIGFAIPVGLAKGVMESIITKGKVTRGYLGVSVQMISPDLQDILHLPTTKGALVGDVLPGSPAEKAGVKTGDIITKLNDTEISDPRHLRLMVGQLLPDSTATLVVNRDGKDMPITVQLKEMPVKSGHGTDEPDASPSPSPHQQIGLRIQDLDDSIRQQLHVPDDVQGPVVVSVDEGSPAEAAGLSQGDIILSVDKAPTPTADEAAKHLRSVKDKVLLRVWSKGSRHYLVVRPADSSK